MSESMQIWTEVAFNIAYLVVVWGLVITMIRNRSKVNPENQRAADLVRYAFTLLALGDTGHVGFRVIAFALGDLEMTVSILGREIGLVGFGTLLTAITVTLFYVLMLELWRVRYGRRYGWFEYLILILIGLRFILMALPQNQWNLVVPVQPWVSYRNLPFFIAGLGIAYLFLRDALRVKDRPFAWIGAMIVISFACYIPVILFVQRVPMIGMLMIPKTMAYVVIGFIAYQALYRRESQEQTITEALPGD